MSSDHKKTISYETYIEPDALPRVQPRTRSEQPLDNDPDESFFIRTHQAFEIWFAQILTELEYARLLLSQPPPNYVPESDVPRIEHHVRRAAAIFELIRQHLPLLETLSTTSFYNFRKYLFGASGTQSHRFREVEWLMGLLDNGLLRYTEQKLDLEHKLSPESKKPKDKVSKKRFGKRSATSYLSQSEREYDSLMQYQDQWNKKWSNDLQDFGPRDFEGMTATRKALRQRMLDIQDNGTLRGRAIQWLGRTAFPAKRSGRPHSKYSELFAEQFQDAYMVAYANDLHGLGRLEQMKSIEIKRLERDAARRARFFLNEPHRRAIVFLLQFSNQPLLAWPASLVEALLELDEAFANWRDRHIAMVSRVLGGGRISTLGAEGSGLPYLRGTLGKRVFPEIWDARSYMLSRDEAKDIYGAERLRYYGFLREKTSPSQED
ncbi:MAG: tryptophan 2,3-dioxygenase [Gammaproteobacteria bacterium]|nr:tryptophan 2,3-dioxygenase [Gammaproteobacteria bacterium]